MSTISTFVLDGIFGRPRRFEGLLKMLRERGGDAEIFDYDSSGRSKFETLGEQLANAIREIKGPVNLIGFSMGGLVIRAAHLHDSTLPIHRVAFLNSPLQGSMLAHALPIGGIRQIRPNDPFIARVQKAEWNVPTLATWCPFDTAVIPGRSAKFANAHQTIRCGVPMHIWPVFSKRIQQAVVNFICDENPSETRAA